MLNKSSSRSIILLVTLLLFVVVFISIIRFSSPVIDDDRDETRPSPIILISSPTTKNQQGSSSDDTIIISTPATIQDEEPEHKKGVRLVEVEEEVIRSDDDYLMKSNLVSKSPTPQSLNQMITIISSSCSTRTNCLTCLFRTSVDCVWLATREKCVEASFAKNHLPGVDAEAFACPAILHSSSIVEKSRLIPAKFNVIHVAIRKGGPEALIQLHLALVYWGFNTNLDSRKSKQQKGGPVVPFFKEMYAKEFARVININNNNQNDNVPNKFQQKFRSHFRDYDHWQKSGTEGDVLIATETWKCRNDREKANPSLSQLLSEPVELRKNGVRYAQWHLTVWPRKPRSGCTIMVHTRYISEVYMRAPLLSLLFPYVSPHIVRLADKMKKQVGSFEKGKSRDENNNNLNLLMFDGDMKMDPKVFNNNNNNNQQKFIVKKAAGFTPQQLYEEYAKASVCLDWELPGGERFIYESALFGCCSIVDRSLNGLDTEDFPLPNSLRVSPSNSNSNNNNNPSDLAVSLLVSNDYILGTKKQQEKRKKLLEEEFASKNNHRENSMHEAISLCTNEKTRAETMKSLEPLRLSILKQRVRFHRHVRRYFSNNIHIVTAVATAEEFKKYVAQFIVTTLIAIPLATIEIVLSKAAAEVDVAEEMKSHLTLLLDHSYLAAVLWTRAEAEDDQTEKGEKQDSYYFSHVVQNSPSIITTSASRVGFVAFVRVESIIANRNFVHYLSSVTSILSSSSSSSTSFSGIRGENFVFFSDVSMFSSSSSKKRNGKKIDLNKTTIKLEDAAKQAIVLSNKRISESQLVWKKFEEIDDDSKENRMWKKFLCDHAIYEMLFLDRC